MKTNVKSVLLMITALLLLSIGLGTIAACLFPYAMAQNTASEIQDEFIEQVEDVSNNGKPTLPDVNWDKLLSANPDIIAWIYVPDTPINYPVVAASKSKSKLYLDHDMYGNYNFAGTPYLDHNCNKDLTSFNSLIFGHNLIDGSMFTAFEKYTSKSYMEKHKTVYLLMPFKTYELNVVAANVVNANSETKQTQFSDMADYHEYWQKQLNDSEAVADDAPLYPYRDFCFVTCSYQTSNARTLVYAVIEDEQFESDPTVSIENSVETATL